MKKENPGKVCIKCDVEKPIDDYGHDKRTPDGRSKTCSECRFGGGKKRKGKPARKAKPEAAPEPVTITGRKLVLERGFGVRASIEDGVLTIEQDQQAEDGSELTAQLFLSRTELKVLAAEFQDWADDAA